MRILVQSEPFDLGDEAKKFASGHNNMGAIVTFTGVVRDLARGDLDCMEIEHYPGMTERALEKIAREALARWSLGDVLVIHRHGPLAPGDMIMMVATAAPHRKDAFEAAEYLMDYLKSRAPFWKKEISRDGADWVAAKDEDEDALTRW
ncbi:molybdenum cofactor biosynthesis protein MoaE [Shimia abyssi]|uniref:Molybdopterin synthase catalytic subunit n=1 Tax=Shimia abyssi TaxID=1662395 RepID=A0A2P8FB56_9RHOB|nr:molybdenum cofactor biosynthesis protein MoaE [Shimia abyssi]PSL18882.1 molybdopterin synthase subunit MoaE [Shimia abyssi]